MAEQIDLTTPEAKPANPSYHLERLTLDIDAGTIHVQLKGANGEALSKVYDKSTTPTGAALLSALNTSNNSTTSLIKRVYQRLTADGVIAGTISGTPA